MALGDGIKRPDPINTDNYRTLSNTVRYSIVVKSGQELTEDEVELLGYAFTNFIKIGLDSTINVDLLQGLSVTIEGVSEDDSI